MEYERLIAYDAGPARRQARIEGEPFHCYTFDDGTVWTEFYRQDGGYLLRFPGLVDFEVSADGTRVRAHPGQSTDDATVEHVYINQLVPLALSRQGRPAFHASVVTVPGGAVAFLGRTGAGKSTLAASFALGEGRFLTDDALLIEESGDGFYAVPSHASVRLWQDSAEALADKQTAQALPVSYSSKARLLAGPALAYQDSAERLIGAYRLDSEGVGSIRIGALSGTDRYRAWLENSFLLDIEDEDLLRAHFDWTYRIAGTVPTFRLDYPRDYGMLGEVQQAIREHAATLND